MFHAIPLTFISHYEQFQTCALFPTKFTVCVEQYNLRETTRKQWDIWFEITTPRRPSGSQVVPTDDQSPRQMLRQMLNLPADVWPSHSTSHLNAPISNYSGNHSRVNECFYQNLYQRSNKIVGRHDFISK